MRVDGDRAEEDGVGGIAERDGAGGGRGGEGGHCRGCEANTRHRQTLCGSLSLSPRVSEGLCGVGWGGEEEDGYLKKKKRRRWKKKKAAAAVEVVRRGTGSWRTIEECECD